MAGVVAGLGLVVGGCEPVPREEALVHSAYVWRQGWTGEAEAGLRKEVIPAEITELNVLVGECGLAGGTREVRVPWAALAASGREISLSVRVGVRRTKDGAPLDNLAEARLLAERGLQKARDNGVPVRELQIDFDCPTRLLPEYAAWLKELRGGLSGMRLTVTTLPTWLGDGEFRTLVEAVDGWTLQVHGTELPTANRPAPLIEAEQALDWIDEARGLGKPFRVALPTYSYLACFSEKGRYLGVRAESGTLPMGTAKTQCMPGDPREVAKVLKALQGERYRLVTAIDWFRLPLPGDRQAWTVEGLGKVIRGEAISREMSYELKQEGALIDVVMVNRTEQPLALGSVRVEWEGAALVGADGTADWGVRAGKDKVAEVTEGAEDRGRGWVLFERREDAGFLEPGGRRIVGWVRLSEAKPVRISGVSGTITER
jgi:hypothetical protein